MLYAKYRSWFFLSCLVFFKSTAVHGIVDPITGSFVIGAFVAGYFMNKQDFYQYFGSCSKTKIDFLELQNDMNEQFFGQHIASKMILSSLQGNFHRSSNNKKPLVMSFHGLTGSGKNFITDIIASHMFHSEKIKKLRYHVFHGASELLLKNIQEYQEELHKKIKSSINKCDSNLFIFDELQDVPEGILDILIPILENNDRSIDSRNSIFIFLTNAGSDSIVKKYLDLWNRGYSRQEMRIQDFDSILQKSAFNELGGLKKSRLIDAHIIDHYIPFLPLEKDHVMQCIEAELRNLKEFMNSKAKSDILQIIPFGPEPHKLFSTSGCKRIKALISAELNSNLI